MVIPELITFIRTSLDQGETIEQIKTVLFENGWTQTDVQEGLWAVQNAHENDPEVLPAKTQARSEGSKIVTDKKTETAKKNVWLNIALWVILSLLFITGFMFAVVVAGAQ